jgi:hypothetical protein
MRSCRRRDPISTRTFAKRRRLPGGRCDRARGRRARRWFCVWWMSLCANDDGVLFLERSFEQPRGSGRAHRSLAGCETYALRLPSLASSYLIRGIGFVGPQIPPAHGFHRLLCLRLGGRETQPSGRNYRVTSLRDRIITWNGRRAKCRVTLRFAPRWTIRRV